MPAVNGAAPLRKALSWVAAAVLAFIVFVSTNWNLGNATSGNLPGSLVPEDPSVTISEAMDEFRSSRGESVQEILPITDAAANYAPLDGRIFLLHAFASLRSDPDNPPFEQLEISRTYGPRLSETRLLLLESYGKTGRPGDAFAEADVLTELLLSDRALIVELLVELVLREEMEPEVAEALSRSPLRGRVMFRLALRRADPELLVYLAQNMRGLARDENERQWIGQFARQVANRIGSDTARDVWAELHDVDGRATGKSVLDPDFASISGTPPFGWDVGRSALGNSEISDGALDVLYYGRREGSLASQLLLLESGDYRLTIEGDSADSDQPDALSWQVSCTEGDEILLSMTVTEIAESSGRPVEFSVPAENCAAQELQLVGTPSSEGRRQSASFESLRIERGGG